MAVSLMLKVWFREKIEQAVPRPGKGPKKTVLATYLRSFCWPVPGIRYESREVCTVF